MPDISKTTEELLSLGIYSAENEPMHRHTSFRIGGDADCFVVPKNEEQLRLAMKICCKNAVPISIIGNGTNLLVSDTGVRGAVIKIGKDFSGIERHGNTLSVLAGTPLISVCEYAANEGLSGLEFAAGIPGTVGGAVFMNAGAYGGEVGSVLKSVMVLNPDGKTEIIAASDCGFRYRESCFQNEPGVVILSADFILNSGEENDIRALMQKNREARQKSQPLDYPNAGSAFRRPPEGLAAAAMIDACGLKGFSFGGAEISCKHAGFIINSGGATCENVLSLLREACRRVLLQYDITLIPEYCLLGEFGEQDGRNR